MPTEPEDTEHFEPWSFMYEWQVRYGELTGPQQGRFLADPKLPEILAFPKWSVTSSLNEDWRFTKIIESLNKTEEYFLEQEDLDSIEIQPEDLGMEELGPEHDLQVNLESVLKVKFIDRDAAVENDAD